MKYRRKPLVFEAIQWNDLPGVHETVFKWMKASGQQHRYENTTGILRFTCKEGGTGVSPGDWLVKDDEGEVYPVLDRRFRRLYDEVPEDTAVEAPPVGTRRVLPPTTR